jgi:AAA family ATP:ADP antiporter
MRGLARVSDALSREPGAATQAIGGSPFAGIGRVLAKNVVCEARSGKLRFAMPACSKYRKVVVIENRSSLFLLLFSITTTFLYFEQAGIAKRSFPDRASQTTPRRRGA